MGELIAEGKKYGYFVNESKSWLILKDGERIEAAKEMFKDTAIKFTSEGKRHLVGAAIGSDNFRKIYAREKVNLWCQEMERLSEYAKTQPHAAYSAFCHGKIHKYTYFMRTIPGMREFIKPLLQNKRDSYSHYPLKRVDWVYPFCQRLVTLN